MDPVAGRVGWLGEQALALAGIFLVVAGIEVADCSQRREGRAWMRWESPLEARADEEHPGTGG